jgi:DUF177 domain-containing protein
MKVDVRELNERGGRFSVEDVTVIVDPLAGELPVPCTVELEYRPSAGGFHFHATVTGSWDTRCHRCLEPVTHSVQGRFDLMVRRGEDGGESSDDVVVLLPQQHEVVLDAYIHETVVVDAPMVVLCGDDCRGLCPTCGANLNHAGCTCETPGDPRWDALKKLK